MFSLQDHLSSAFSYKPFSGCVMASLSPSYSWQQYVQSLGIESPIELELDPHVTVIYGIRSAEMLNVHEYIKSWSLSYGHLLTSVRIDKVATRFENADRDVLKFDVVGMNVLKLLRDELINKFSCKIDFPVYEPHVTIAYVNKNSNTKAIVAPDNRFNVTGFELSWKGVDTNNDASKIKKHLPNLINSLK